MKNNLSVDYKNTKTRIIIKTAHARKKKKKTKTAAYPAFNPFVGFFSMLAMKDKH